MRETHVKSILFLLMLIGSVTISATEITTRIHDIITPDKSDEAYLLLATDGNIYEVREDKLEVIDLAYEAMELKKEITLKLVDVSINKILGLREHISAIELKSSESAFPEINFELETDIPTPLDNYDMTVLPDMESALKLFRTQATRTRRRSQCYNRAHVWSYELSKKKFNGERIKTGKVWLFFTRKYIKQYKYKWWFHISPIIKVAGQSEDIVLDRKFSRNPLPLTVWKDIFMKNDAPCPTVKYYSDYNNNQWINHCYYIKSSMYYWQPFNIENLEKGEPEKRIWDKSELVRAYRNAIKGWDGELR